MPSPSSKLAGIDREALARVVEPVVRAHGAELVELEFRPEHQGWVLRVVVEKAGAAEKRMSTRDAAVDLELCAGVARDLSPALDVSELIAQAYRLEVGSPGIERALHGERDFARFTGEKARLKLREGANVTVAGEAEDVAAPPSEGAVAKAAGDRTGAHAKAWRGGKDRVIVGTLNGVADGKVRVAADGDRGQRILEVPLSAVEGARLVFEFGTQQRKH